MSLAGYIARKQIRYFLICFKLGTGQDNNVFNNKQLKSLKNKLFNLGSERNLRQTKCSEQ